MNINLTLIGQTITFAVFVWFCMKFVWPPIMNALEERKTRIADGLAAAEASKRAKAEAESRAGEVLDEARGRAAEAVAYWIYIGASYRVSIHTDGCRYYERSTVQTANS